MIIGLTGGTGTGKTSVSKLFLKEGFEVIDYDKVTREVYVKGSPCLEEITKNFGKGILNADGTLNRKALGEIVFSKKEALDTLNNIVYKYILAHTKDIIENSHGKKLLLDAPTLFESGLSEKCDKIIGVIADRDIKIKRVSARDGLTPQRVMERIDMQLPDSFYIKNCDYIIENNHSLKELEEKANSILKELNV